MHDVTPTDPLWPNTGRVARRHGGNTGSTHCMCRFPTSMGSKPLVSRACELMGVRMHWKMSNDVIAVVEHLMDARESRAATAEKGQNPHGMADQASRSAHRSGQVEVRRLEVGTEAILKLPRLRFTKEVRIARSASLWRVSRSVGGGVRRRIPPNAGT